MTVLWFLHVWLLLISDQCKSSALLSDVSAAENWHAELSPYRGSHAYGRKPRQDLFIGKMFSKKRKKNKTCATDSTHPSCSPIPRLSPSTSPSRFPVSLYTSLPAGPIFLPHVHIHMEFKGERSHQPASSPSSITTIRGSTFSPLLFVFLYNPCPTRTPTFCSFFFPPINTNLQWWIGSLTDAWGRDAVGVNVVWALGGCRIKRAWTDEGRNRVIWYPTKIHSACVHKGSVSVDCTNQFDPGWWPTVKMTNFTSFF